MTPEDEEFERISREIRRNAAEDDDIQDYKKPWVGLTDEDLAVCGDEDDVMLARYWERVIKEKNT